MATDPIDELNSGFVQELLTDYLASPRVRRPPVARPLRGAAGARPRAAAERPPPARALARRRRRQAAPRPRSRLRPRPTTCSSAASPPSMSLVKAHRTHGHLAAHIDPLGSEAHGDPALDPDRLEPRLTPELQARIPAKFLRLYVQADNLAEALPKLRETYCGTLAFEVEHISSHEQRLWLRAAIESGRYRQPLGAEEKRALLARLSRVEGFERYLRRAFLGQKQFSIEGLDVMVPMLDEAIELAAANGANHVVIGMAHRGRLNVLAHTVGREVDAILREFEGERVDRGGLGRPRVGLRRRQVPPGRRSASRDAERRRHDHAHLEPQPSRVRRPRGRGRGARLADESRLARRRARPRPGAADPHPRRRRLPRPGRRRGDAQPRRPRRLHDGRARCT